MSEMRVILWAGPMDGRAVEVPATATEFFVTGTPSLGPGVAFGETPKYRYWLNRVTERFEWDRNYLPD